jgi:hypothetical protein
LAEELLEKEVIFKENLEGIFGKRQWEKPEEELPAKKKEAKVPDTPVANAPKVEGVSNPTSTEKTDTLTQS